MTERERLKVLLYRADVIRREARERYVKVRNEKENS